MPVQPVKLNPRRRGNSVPPCQRYTPADFRREFPTDDACLEYLFLRRWPGGLVWCFKCQRTLRHYKVTGRQAYACRQCGGQIHPTAGTIFHKSRTPLTTWFYVMRLMASTRVGISAKQIQREVGVTYKTAWRMMAQVRKLMAEHAGTVKLAGPVEIDDAVFGGSDTNKHLELRGGAKQAVVGIVARHSGKVVTRVVDSVTKDAVQPIVGEVLPPRTTIYSDEHVTYGTLAWMGQNHRHQTVNHSRGWVKGFAHTQTIDGFWGLVKRGIGAVYRQVGRDYLQSYLNEYSFRTNRRFAHRPMFSLLVERGGEQVCPAVWETRRLAAAGLLPTTVPQPRNIDADEPF